MGKFQHSEMIFLSLLTIGGKSMWTKVSPGETAALHLELSVSLANIWLK